MHHLRKGCTQMHVALAVQLWVAILDKVVCSDKLRCNTGKETSVKAELVGQATQGLVQLLPSCGGSSRGRGGGGELSLVRKLPSLSCYPHLYLCG